MNASNGIIRIIDSIDKSLEQSNHFAALAVSFMLIESCGKIEYPEIKANGRIFKKWVTNYLNFDHNILDANDLWLIRCSLLHEGAVETKYEGKKRITGVVPFIKLNTDASVSSFENEEGDSTAFFDMSYFSKEVIKKASEWESNNREKISIAEKDFYNIAYLTESDGKIRITRIVK